MPRPIVRAQARPIVQDAAIERLRTGVFSPASLLTGPGDMWHDPSDFSTMYQDMGITPVTAVGQAVGLLLDKSKGGPGPELVVNGGFDTAATWSLVQPTAGATTISGGQLRLNTTDGTVAAADQAGIVAIGKAYVVTLDVVAITGAGIRVDIGGTAGILLNTVGPKRFVAVASTGTTVRVVRNSAATDATVDNVSVKELPGVHFAASGTARFTLKQDGSGFYCLTANGTTGIMTTLANVDLSAADRVMACMGVRKASDATLALLLELSVDAGVNPGTFAFLTPSGSAIANYRFRSRGTAIGDANITSAAYAAPHSAVLTGIAQIATDTSILRVNGAQVANSAVDQGATATYGSYPMQMGGRAAGFKFNGDIYQNIVRAGDFDARLEQLVASKMGIVL